MQIKDIIALIPEDDTGHDEALFAIETIISYPFANAAKLRIYPMNEFRLWIKLEGDSVLIEAEGRPTVRCTPDGVVDALRKEIYAVDEAISAGRYRQTPPRENLITDAPPPPSGMDLPVWDQVEQRWHDAEY